MVAAVRNAAVAGDVSAVVGIAAADNVVVVVGTVAAVVVWVQQCLMRPCTSPQFSFVSVNMGSINNPGPIFNSGEAGVFSTTVLVIGMMLACAVAPCGSMVVMVGITLAGAVNPCGSW